MKRPLAQPFISLLPGSKQAPRTGVDADPVICEPERGARRYPRHVTAHAVRHGRVTMRGGVTSGADGIVMGRVVAAKRIVRGVAGEAGEPVAAFAETGAAAQVRG